MILNSYIYLLEHTIIMFVILDMINKVKKIIWLQGKPV